MKKNLFVNKIFITKWTDWFVEMIEIKTTHSWIRHYLSQENDRTRFVIVNNDLNLSPFGFTLNTQYRWFWCHFWSLKTPVPIHRNNNSDQYITFGKTHWSKWQFSFLGWTIPLRFTFLPLTAVSKHMKSLLLNDWANIHDLRLYIILLFEK